MIELKVDKSIQRRKTQKPNEMSFPWDRGETLEVGVGFFVPLNAHSVHSHPGVIRGKALGYKLSFEAVNPKSVKEGANCFIDAIPSREGYDENVVSEIAALSGKSDDAVRAFLSGGN